MLGIAYISQALVLRPEILGQDATLVLVGGPKTNPWVGPLGHFASVRLASLGASQKVVFVVAKFTERTSWSSTSSSRPAR
jgi:hypothetical protein